MQQLAKKDPEVARRMHLLTYRVLEEFYAVQNDPDCLVNLIDDPAYQEEIERYRAILADWLREIDDPLLAVFLDRQDPKVLQQYMREQQQLTQARKEWKRAIRESLQQQKKL